MNANSYSTLSLLNTTDTRLNYRQFIRVFQPSISRPYGEFNQN